jgi:hypothetical protein
MMLVRIAEASAPQAERKPPMTFRWMTEGRKSRSELLLVGSTSDRLRKTYRLSRCVRYRCWSRVASVFGATERSNTSRSVPFAISVRRRANVAGVTCARSWCRRIHRAAAHLLPDRGVRWPGSVDQSSQGVLDPTLTHLRPEQISTQLDQPRIADVVPLVQVAQ